MRLPYFCLYYVLLGSGMFGGNHDSVWLRVLQYKHKKVTTIFSNYDERKSYLAYDSHRHSGECTARGARGQIKNVTRDTHKYNFNDHCLHMILIYLMLIMMLIPLICETKDVNNGSPIETNVVTCVID